jgi:hypothetical protein
MNIILTSDIWKQKQLHQNGKSANLRLEHPFSIKNSDAFTVFMGTESYGRPFTESAGNRYCKLRFVGMI